MLPYPTPHSHVFGRLLAAAVLLWVSACAGPQPNSSSDNTPLPPIATAGFFDGSSSPADVGMALMEADPVSRFPRGVHDPALGDVVRGDPSQYRATFKHATFVFASAAHLVAFIADPEQFIPEVGGYCLGAMSQRKITPGDPRNVFFVPEEESGGMWAVYGRPEGAKSWADMSSEQRRQALTAAHAYYRDRINSH